MRKEFLKKPIDILLKEDIEDIDMIEYVRNQLSSMDLSKDPFFQAVCLNYLNAILLFMKDYVSQEDRTLETAIQLLKNATIKTADGETLLDKIFSMIDKNSMCMQCYEKTTLATATVRLCSAIGLIAGFENTCTEENYPNKEDLSIG